MSVKKSTTKQPKKSRAELRAQLARDLAGILTNPECPVVLYNDIADALCDMSSDINYHTPEMIERTLAAYAIREKKRQGGAS